MSLPPTLTVDIVAIGRHVQWSLLNLALCNVSNKKCGAHRTLDGQRNMALNPRGGLAALKLPGRTTQSGAPRHSSGDSLGKAHVLSLGASLRSASRSPCKGPGRRDFAPAACPS